MERENEGALSWDDPSQWNGHCGVKEEGVRRRMKKGVND